MLRGRSEGETWDLRARRGDSRQDETDLILSHAESSISKKPVLACASFIVDDYIYGLPCRSIDY